MSGFKVEFSVLNLKATPGIYADAFANRPAAGYPGRVFIDTDNPSTGMYRDTGTVWVQIAETATSDVDTLQNVTNNGNTTTNSITVGAATTPAGTIDVRRATASLNNATDYGIVAISSPTIPNGAIFGVNNVNAIAGSEVLTFAGSATIGNNGLNSAGIFTNVLTSTGAGTVTVGQGSTLRSISGLQSVVYYNTAAATTFTHVAAIKTTQPINSGAAAASVTNNYGIIVADNTANSGTITYTNRWGIYQEGASDKNYFAANVLIKSTTDNGNALQVTGQANFTSNVGIGTTSPSQRLSVFGGNLLVNNGVSSDANSGIRIVAPISTTQYNWMIAAQQNINNGFEITPSTAVGGTTFSTSALSILATGNVGIGTTSPTEKLQVVGAIVASNQITNTDVIKANTNNANGTARIGTYYNNALIAQFVNDIKSASSTEYGYMQASDGTNYIAGSKTVFEYGNVGIGTTSPTYKLEVNNAARVGNSSGAIILSGDGGSGNIWTDIATPLRLGANNAEYIRITSGGELLINTTTDVGDFKLQVSGNAYVSGTVGINTTSPNAASLLQMDSTTKGFLLPRMTDAQITAISNPPDGLMVYSTDQNHIAFWNASAGVWKKVSNSNL